MKKLLLLLLCLTMCLLAFSGCSSSGNKQSTTPQTTEEPYPEANPASDFEYSVADNNTNTIVITSFRIREAERAVVPSHIDGKPVVEIGKCAFQYKNKLKTVILPNTVVKIGSAAFEGCSSLENIRLPNAIETIGMRAFKDCANLIHIDLPKTLTEWDGAFSYSGLKSATLEEGITRIPSYAFEGSIISSIVVPGSVKEISHFAFGYCYQLESVTLNDGIESISDTAFDTCKNLKEIVIPQSVTSINESTFNNCPSLEKVTFLGNAPENFININGGLGTFTIYYSEKAQGFTYPRWHGYSTRIIGSKDNPDVYNDFEYQEVNGEIIVLGYLGSNTVLTIPSEINGKPVTQIGHSAFKSNSTLEAVTLPNTIKVISERAFAFSYVKAVTLPSSLEIIEDKAFYCAWELQDINLPNCLTSIGEDAFSNCKELKYIELPSGIKSLPSGAFYASGIENITLNEGLQIIGNGALGLTKIKNITLPTTVTTIGERAFISCSLENIVLNKSLITIGNYAFYSTTLKSITIPHTVKYLSELAFFSMLERLVFEGNAPADFDSDHKDAEDLNFTVYYHENATGFTSPEWCGYRTEIIN